MKQMVPSELRIHLELNCPLLVSEDAEYLKLKTESMSNILQLHERNTFKQMYHLNRRVI